MRLETDKLTLRPFIEHDASATMHNSSTPIVAHFMSDMVLHTEKEAVDWINWINNEKFNIDTPFICLAVILKETDTCIGLVGVAPKHELGGEIEVLFSIADEYQNKGYITEAASTLIAWVFEYGKTECIVAIVKLDNIASNKVIQKLGFVYVGERSIDYDGKMTDFYYYRLEKENV